MILIARYADTNHNDWLDAGDSAQLFSFDLVKHPRQTISPDGFHLERVQILGDELVMALSQEPDRKLGATYVYNVAANSGRFVARNIEP